MLRKKQSLNELAVRKQLLVTEADLYRAEMRQDFQVIEGALDQLARKARSVGAVASTVALVFGGLAAFRGIRKPARHNGRPSWLARILSGARLVSTFWRGFSSVRRPGSRAHF